MNNERTLDGTAWTLKLIPYQTKWVVEAYLNGAFWDYQEFETEALARAYMDDPFNRERQANKAREARAKAKELESAPYYAADYVRVSKGRKVAPKSGH